MARANTCLAVFPALAAMAFATGCSYSSGIKAERLKIELDPEERLAHSIQLDGERSSFKEIAGQWGGTDISIDTANVKPVIESILTEEFTPADSDGAELLLEVDIGSTKRPGETRVLLGYLNARVRTPGDPRVIWKSENEIRIPWSYSAGAAASDFMSGFTLGLSTPLTIPTRTLSEGGKAEDLVIEYISVLLYDILMEIHASGARFSYAIGDPPRGGSGSDAEEGRRADAEPKAAPPSRFDPQLDCVVIISSGESSGSGFFVSPSGLIVTNQHVVQGESVVTIRQRDGRVRVGEVVAIANGVDLALVKVEAGNQPWLELERYGDTGIGADLFVIGTPVGLDWSMTRGIASQFRDFEGAGLCVQTDASINPGNSGGPIICAETGRVVGVATFGLRTGKSDTGLNFGIHASEVLGAFPELNPLHRKGLED
jgi:hypothetical protein